MKPLHIGPRIIDALSPTLKDLSGPILDKFKVLLTNPETTPEQFLSLLPPERLLAIVLATTDKPTADQMPEVIRRDLVPLSELVASEIPALKLHEGFHRAVQIAGDRVAQANTTFAFDEGIGGSWKTVVGLNGMPLLVGDEQPMIPVLRILLKTNVPGTEFDFTCSALDLAFLAKGFGEFLADMLEKRVSLVGSGVVEILNKPELVKKIFELDRALQRIKQLAPQFGLLLTPPEDSAQQNPVHPGSDG